MKLKSLPKHGVEFPIMHKPRDINRGMCMVMYCDFEEGEDSDPDMERVSLCCGCWVASSIILIKIMLSNFICLLASIVQGQFLY